MSILVGITQRVVEHDGYKERRDALAQDWAPFLEQADIAYIPLPNAVEASQRLLDILPLTGIILSGGNGIGDAPERDALEAALLGYSIKRNLPVLGVCRGMQVMHHFAGGTLEEVSGHVKTRHRLNFKGRDIEVNSFHDQGFLETTEHFEVMARAEDGVVEAMRHKQHDWYGVMWHPEREAEADPHDLALFREIFGK